MPQRQLCRSAGRLHESQGLPAGCHIAAAHTRAATCAAIRVHACTPACACIPAGGQPYSIIGVLDAIQSIKPDVQTVALGACYSYASLILVGLMGGGVSPCTCTAGSRVGGSTFPAVLHGAPRTRRPSALLLMLISHMPRKPKSIMRTAMAAALYRLRAPRASATR